MHIVKNKLPTVYKSLSRTTSNIHGHFASSKTGKFIQGRPSLGNQYLNDPFLQKYLLKSLPPEVSTFLVGLNVYRFHSM